MKSIRILTTFSGYDSQLLAMQRLTSKHGLQFDCVGWSDIDKFAIRGHNALFPELEQRNLGDVTKIDWSQLPDFDLLTYSSPCQDVSHAGKRQGIAADSGTRSSLLWEIAKAAGAKRPKFLLMENVPGILHYKDEIRKWMRTLAELGYYSEWRILNSKDFGIPQDRARFFLVSVLDGDAISWPNPRPLQLSLKDICNSECLNTTEGGLARTLQCQYSRLGFQQMLSRSRAQTGVISYTRETTGPGKIKSYHLKNLSNTLAASQSGTQAQFVIHNGFVRKFTPQECFLLMGCSLNEAKTLCGSGLSNTALYRLAGNSIVVNVLEAIFERLFITPNREKQLTLF